MASIEQRVREVERRHGAKRASQKKDKPTIDYSKLSDAALEEMRASCNECGRVEVEKLSDSTLEEIVAARIV